MFELIMILGLAFIAWTLITKTDIAKNISDLLSGRIGLSEEQQEIMESASEPDICNSSVGAPKEILTNIPTSINYEPTPIQMPSLGDNPELTNRIDNADYFDDHKGERITPEQLELKLARFRGIGE